MEHENKKRFLYTHQESSQKKINHTDNSKAGEDALWHQMADAFVKGDMEFEKSWQEKQKNKEQAGQSNKRKR